MGVKHTNLRFIFGMFVWFFLFSLAFSLELIVDVVIMTTGILLLECFKRLPRIFQFVKSLTAFVNY